RIFKGLYKAHQRCRTFRIPASGKKQKRQNQQLDEQFRVHPTKLEILSLYFSSVPFRCLMELQFRELSECVIDIELRACQKYRTLFLIVRYFGRVAVKEFFKCFRSFRRHPIGLACIHRAEPTGSPILLKQTELNHLELKLSHRADNLPVSRVLNKELRHPFIAKLRNPLFQLLGLQRISILQFLKYLGRETRD